MARESGIEHGLREEGALASNIHPKLWHERVTVMAWGNYEVTVMDSIS